MAESPDWHKFSKMSTFRQPINFFAVVLNRHDSCLNAVEQLHRFTKTMKILLRISFLSLALMAGIQSYGQTTVYGVNVGFGKSTEALQGEEPTLVSPFDSDNQDFMQIGLDYAYAPGKSNIYFKSGLLYNARTTDDTALDYIRAPLGLDVGIGNTFQVIVGANVFTSFLLAHTGFDDVDYFNDNLRRFQFGWGGNLGFGLDLSEKIHLNVVYQRNFDLTEMYSIETRTQEGLVTENFMGQDGFVRMGLNYKIRAR